MDKLFPPFLNVGSHGAAVRFLQGTLQVRGFAAPSLICDGDYGEQTVQSVKSLQRTLGLEDDGNFGPATRVQLKDTYYLDLDAVIVGLGSANNGANQDTFWIGPDNPEGSWHKPV